MSELLQFEDTALALIDRDAQKWVRVDQLDRPLGYKSARSVALVYERNADEFGARETALITLDTAGGPQQVRVFSLRGVRLLALLAKTDRAKRFRAWVLDLIERDDADRDARLATLNGQVKDLRGAILAEKPLWNKIVRYWEMNYDEEEIATIIGRSSPKTRELCNMLSTMGVLPPRDWTKVRFSTMTRADAEGVTHQGKLKLEGGANA